MRTTTTTLSMRSNKEEKSPGLLSSPILSFFRRSPHPRVRRFSTTQRNAHWASPDETYPRSLSMPSEGPTLLNGTSSQLSQSPLEDNPLVLTNTSLNAFWSSSGVLSSPTIRLPSIQIAGRCQLLSDCALLSLRPGISVKLCNPTSKELGLRLIVNGEEFSRLPSRDDHLRGDWSAPVHWQLEFPLYIPLYRRHLSEETNFSCAAGSIQL